MNAIVLDASVTLSWCFPDEQTPMALQVLDRLQAGDRAIVPSFWAVEVLNVLLVGERKGRITSQQTRTFFNALQMLGPAIDHVGLEQVAGQVQTICRDYRLTPYDALYIDLALRAGGSLATLDGPQREAARALGVTCL